MVIDEILGLLARAEAAPYIGEPVSQLEHALQAAALAAQAGADPTLIAAALLHDIGHQLGASGAQMASFGARDHERIGAEYLARAGFGAELSALVEGHVPAKRYLVATRPEYAARLSDASRETLVHQGGAMSAAEQRAFEARPRHRDMLRLRAWDEQAKEPKKLVPGLDAYTELLRELLRSPR